MGTLVLVRHGESRWNVSGRFTGWVDVPLSEKGVHEAERCAEHCKEYDFDVAFTSALERAHATLLIILSRQNRTGIIQHEGDHPHYKWRCYSNKCDGKDIPVFESEALNERYYGLLQGMDKKEAVKIYGREKVFAWRRGYVAKPPRGESMKDAFERTWPYFEKKIMPRIRRGETVMIAGHGNTLRAMIKRLEKISDDAISRLDLPEAKPVAYDYHKGKWTRIEDGYTFDRPLR